MKILFDQNISHRVVNRILHDFPEAKHVRDFNMRFSTDMEIWKFAKEHSYTIVTFDADFYDFLILKGHPPKIIWLRFGNTQTQLMAERIKSFKDVIEAFVNDPLYKEIGCLEIDN